MIFEIGQFNSVI